MSKPLRNISRRATIAALTKLGFEVIDGRGKGSHALIVHPEDRSRRSTLPRRDPVAVGTLRGILRDLGISREEFEQAI
ncbi:MAG: type II toxin-antitoxin system HicA family toxin [Planctomycetota bacterium]